LFRLTCSRQSMRPSSSGSPMALLRSSSSENPFKPLTGHEDSLTRTGSGFGDWGTVPPAFAPGGLPSGSGG
jgi:hypothetical protein